MPAAPPVDPVPDIPVVVLGLMGAGKTTLATALAERWGRPLRDSDVDLLAETGRTAAELAATEGADGLHRREVRHLLDALTRRPAPVVAAAAFTVEVEECRRALRAGARVVWVDVPVDELVRRQAGGPHRPVYGPDVRAMLVEMDRVRRPLFGRVADVVVGPATAGSGPDQAPAQVERALRGAASAGLGG